MERATNTNIGSFNSNSHSFNSTFTVEKNDFFVLFSLSKRLMINNASEITISLDGASAERICQYKHCNLLKDLTYAPHRIQIQFDGVKKVSYKKMPPVEIQIIPNRKAYGLDVPVICIDYNLTRSLADQRLPNEFQWDVDWGFIVFPLEQLIARSEVAEFKCPSNIKASGISYETRSQDPIIVIPKRLPPVVYRTESISLAPIFFLTDDDVITLDSQDTMLSNLDSIKRLFEQHDLRILIRGHCDPIEAKEKNSEIDWLKKHPKERPSRIYRSVIEYATDLSQRRAKAVFGWLVAHGIAPSRLIVKGFADSLPIDNRPDEYARDRNRRVDFEIVEE